MYENRGTRDENSWIGTTTKSAPFRIHTTSVSEGLWLEKDIEPVYLCLRNSFKHIMNSEYNQDILIYSVQK